MWRRILLGLLGLSLVSACGDGAILIVVNSGVIVGAPRCGPPGRFDLRQTGGLTVLVVITNTTRIVLASGGSGSCADLSADAAVQVSGRRSGDQIVATVVAIE